MKINKNLNVYVLYGAFFISYFVYIYHADIWKFMEKIGALATALALFAAMYQGYVAWKAASLTREANSQNLFQQKFNLVLEQHNESLAKIRDWVTSAKYLEKKLNTECLVSEIRGHEQLSPYMRILYHTLKSIKEELPVTDELDEKELIKTQKRYTSLVRSFIPNDILFLVACNASVTDGKIFEINNSQSYWYYNSMLKRFDFFEHLNTQADNKINLEDLSKEITKSVYESCYLYYFNGDTMGMEDEKNNTHIKKLNEFLSNPFFFICLEYNLKNKAIDTSNFINKPLSMHEIFINSLNEKIATLNEEGLTSYMTCKTNAFYKEKVECIIHSKNNIYTDLSSSILTPIKGLYYEPPLVEFLSSLLRYDMLMSDLLIFRDSFHSTLKKTLLKSSSHLKKQYWYQDSVDMSYAAIVKEISPLIDHLISLRNKINYNESPSDILKTKKKEFQIHINTLFY